MCLLAAGTCSNAEIVPAADLQICGHYQRNTSDKTCIVDGDTPESRTNICGGFVEIDLAHAATDRLKELLNSNVWTIETFGIDGTGERRLATIRIDGVDVGDILIAEKLARRWPDGEESWCK